MTPVATFSQSSTKPVSAVARLPLLSAETLDAHLAHLEPQMLAILDDAISVAQENRRNPEVPTRKEWLLANAKAASISPTNRLRSLLRLCEPHRFHELKLTADVLALL